MLLGVGVLLQAVDGSGEGRISILALRAAITRFFCRAAITRLLCVAGVAAYTG
jgi:hypothetical protein